MRILVSNDDGILAPGLAQLQHAVADLGEVTVAAPDSPQSAAGHSITLRHPLAVQRIRVQAQGAGFEGLSIDGRPADCVRLAIRSLLSQPPELVLSGINAGNNVGVNVFYSGTVAAAAEAAMMGIPAVAFSASMVGQVDLVRTARLCRYVLDRLLEAGLTRGDLINVNIPALDGDRPRGIRVVPQSVSGIEDLYTRVEDDDRELYRLGDDFRYLESPSNTDVFALEEGYITVTPLHVDMTNHDRLAMVERTQWGELPPADTR